VSDLDDPRVLFAAERTLLAWSRTAAGLMGFGFIVDRTTLLIPSDGALNNFGFWIGLTFIVVGVLLSGLSIVQYRRAVATLRPIEIPPGYWTNLSVYASGVVGLLGILVAVFIALG
jgi:putative membrane protein